jgi:xanthine dehydrogenase YagR molybdenum-binding subunit
MTATVEPARLVGAPVDRVEGPQKVRGETHYPTDVQLPNLAHAALVRSTVAAGTIRAIDLSAAQASPGVVRIVTHANAPKLHKGKRDLITPPLEPPLQTREIHHYGQYVAIVVAETPHQAREAARLVRVEYDAREALLDPGQAELKTNPYHLDMKRGHVDEGFASADVVVEATYSTSEQAHSPIGLFATVAHWEGDALTIYDSTQNPFHLRDVLAASFEIHEDRIRVLAPFVGGAFGAGLRVSHHTLLTAVAARIVERPVKLVLTRPEMFTGLGRRPRTVQHVRIGATNDGTLVAIDHVGTTAGSVGVDALYPLTMGTVAAYACPNVSARDQRVELNVPPLAHMRAPGEAEGNFALETALDELAVELGIDPIELRLRNYAETHPQTGLPWSSKALRECYAVGAERFGWAERTPEPGSLRDGRWLVGWGFAGITYGHHQVECKARATLRRDGTAVVASGTTEIGVGTKTVMTQLAAEHLELPLERVEFRLGDTELPRAPYVGGSGLTIALGSAVHDACGRLREKLVELAGRDVSLTDDAVGELLASHGLDELSADGESAPPRGELGVQIKSLIVSHTRRGGAKLVEKSGGTVPAGAFGARFVEVGVDPDLGLLRIRRVLSVIDAGRVLNEKTARSQIVGGTIQGIGMAMFEDVINDAGTGRVANPTFGDYLVPVNADVPDMDVVFVGEPDPMNPIGVKGVGEVGFAGVPAAISNAVFHATGKRLRSLPITIDQLLL